MVAISDGEVVRGEFLSTRLSGAANMEGPGIPGGHELLAETISLCSSDAIRSELIRSFGRTTAARLGEAESFTATDSVNSMPAPLLAAFAVSANEDGIERIGIDGTGDIAVG